MLFTHSPFQEDSIPSPLSEFCPYGLELPTRGVYVEWWSFEEASIVETNVGSFSYKKKNLVFNFLMSYRSKNKPLRSSSNKLWLLRGSVNLSCRIACMGVVSVRVRFLEGERSLRGESSTTNSSNWTFYVEKLLF